MSANFFTVYEDARPGRLVNLVHGNDDHDDVAPVSKESNLVRDVRKRILRPVLNRIQEEVSWDVIMRTENLVTDVSWMVGLPSRWR
jgi:hypothetical protein